MTTMPSASQTRRAFRRLRFRMARNGLRSLVSGSRLRVVMIFVCSAIFWAGLFGLFYGGFQFIDMYGALAGDFVMSGGLTGSVRLDLAMSGAIEPGDAGTVLRKAGSTTVTGKATSGTDVFNVNLTL